MRETAILDATRGATQITSDLLGQYIEALERLRRLFWEEGMEDLRRGEAVDVEAYELIGSLRNLMQRRAGA